MCVPISSLLCAAAAGACDEILVGYLGVRVDKASPLNPLDPHDFMAISSKIADRCQKVSHEMQALIVRRTIETLDVDWPNLTSAQRQRIVVAARTSIVRSAPRTSAAVTASLKADSTPLVKSTKQASIREFDLNIRGSLTAFDERVSQYAWSSQGNFITQFYRGRADMFSGEARSIIASGLERGLRRQDIVDELRSMMHQGVVRTDAYLEVIAATFANRARTWAQIGSFAEAGIQAYRWSSVLDEVTTETCRFLHDKVFSTGDALNQFERVESAGGDDPDEQKTLSPWVREGRDDDGNRILFTKPTPDSPRTVVAQIDRGAAGQSNTVGNYSNAMSNKQLADSGLSLPPIHGLCRSTVVPEDIISGPRTTIQPASPGANVPPPRVVPEGGAQAYAKRLHRELQGAEFFEEWYEPESIAGQRKVRDSLREHLSGYGMQTKTTRSFVEDLGAAGKRNRIRYNREFPSELRGQMDLVSADVEVHPEVWRDGINALEEIAENPDRMIAAMRTSKPRLQQQWANNLRTFFHEETHGMSPMWADANYGGGKALEEATTEIIAKRATRDLIGVHAHELPTSSPLRAASKTIEGYWTSTGSYERRVGRLFAAVERALGKPIATEAEWIGLNRQIEEAAIAMRSRPATGSAARRARSALAHVDDFVDQPALQLTKKGRERLRRELYENVLDSDNFEFSRGLLEAQ